MKKLRSDWWIMCPVIFPLLVPIVWPLSLILIMQQERHHPVHGIVYDREFEPGHPVGMAYAGDRWWLYVREDNGEKLAIKVDKADFHDHEVGTRYDNPDYKH